MKYTEETLSSWTRPASNTEEQKMETTIKMIKDAIDRYAELKQYDLEVFVQGSYANNTNVKANSDVDVCVMVKNVFFAKYYQGRCNTDYGIQDVEFDYYLYRAHVLRAMIDKFGADSVILGNKSIKIRSNSYHVNADVVPKIEYRNYESKKSINPLIYTEGVYMIAKDGSEVINYPKLHIENGRRKNNLTRYRYKYLVRIFKRIRNQMVEESIIDGDIISSFLVECLIWNTPGYIIMMNPTWTATVKETISFLYDAVSNQKYAHWKEVSEQIDLFGANRKWTPDNVQDFLLSMWMYLERDK